MRDRASVRGCIGTLLCGGGEGVVPGRTVGSYSLFYCEYFNNNNNYRVTQTIFWVEFGYDNMMIIFITLEY